MYPRYCNHTHDYYFLLLSPTPADFLLNHFVKRDFFFRTLNRDAVMHLRALIDGKLKKNLMHEAKKLKL